MLIIFFVLGFVLSVILTTVFWFYVAYIKLPKLSKAFRKFFDFYKECDTDFWESDSDLNVYHLGSRFKNK